MQVARSKFAALVLVVMAAGAHGNGSIDDTGTVYTLGNAPSKGTLTKDACAPPAAAPAISPLGTLGAIGTFSAPLPAFPGGGSGADGIFVGSATTTLPGGTFNFSSFTVNAGAVLTYTGSVTILTTGNASVLGTVETNSPDSSITFRCAGDFTLGATARVRTLMGTSPIIVDAGQGFGAAAAASIGAAGSDIEINAHGLNATAGNVMLAATDVFTSTAAVRLRAQGAVSATGSMNVGSAPGGSLLTQAFGGDVSFTGGANAQVGDAGSGVVVEAAGAVMFSGATSSLSGIFAEDGGISARAFGGEVAILNGIDARSSGHVNLAAGAGVRTSKVVAGGAFTATAHGGDVDVQSASSLAIDAGADIVLDASGDVAISGNQFEADGEFRIRAIGGDATMTASQDLLATRLDVRAAGSITTSNFFTQAAAMKLSAGAGGIALGNGILTVGGPVDVVALGPVTVAGNVTAFGNLTITSCNAGVDTTGGNLATREQSDVSGDITVQSFAGAAAVIDVAGSSITTEDAGVESGSIRILARESKVAGRFADIKSFLLPRKVVVKTNAKTPAKSKVTISGSIDEGATEPGWTEPSTLDVGTAKFAIPGMTATGASFEHTEPGLFFRVTPGRTGGSRGSFLIVRTADVTNEVSRDGALVLRFAGTGIDAGGTVTLAKGKFALGKIRGGLIIPCIFPQSVAAKLKGPGQDKLSLVMGFETAGYDVTMDPCFKIVFGDTFTAEIPRASFTARGATLVFKGNVNGITDVKVDLANELITVKGKAMTLTGLPAGGGAVKITVTLDSVALGIDERSVTVQLFPAGATLKY